MEASRNRLHPAASNPMETTVNSWSTLPELKLGAGVEILTSADGRPLLKAPNGRFVVVSTASSGLLRLLNEGVSGPELAEATAAARSSATRPDNQDAVAPFLGTLDRAGMLTISDPEGRPAAGFFAGVVVDFMKRIPFKGFPADRVFDPASRRLRRMPPRLLAALMLMAFVLSAALAPLILSGKSPGANIGAFLVGAVLVLAVLPLHETCHAIAMRYWKVHIREVGVGLLAFVTPVAYIDRTETYALRSRWGRLTIALVGPACDAVFALVFAVLSRVVPPFAGVFVIAAVMQLGVMIMNLNPLLRGDGYHAVEALFGKLNIRAHAFEYVIRAALRKQQPAHLRNLSGRVRFGYVAYVSVSVAYMLVAATALLYVVVSVAGATT